jgi:hypothetical protein
VRLVSATLPFYMVVKRYTGFAILLLAFCSLAQEVPQEPPSVTFRAQTRLVLLSFHVTRGRDYVPNLTRADIELLEDGKPRDFTIFDSPATQGRMPLELVLLFDTNPRIDYFWDPADVCRFIPSWDDARSQTILEHAAADIRISVYHCAGQTLYSSSPATTNPQIVTAAFRRLLTAQSPGPKSQDTPIALSLPAKRQHVDRGPFTDDYVRSPFVSAEARGWPMEAAIAALNEVAAASDKVARVLVMFSEGIGATTTIPEDIGNEALDLGVPIYPIVTNYQGHIDSSRWPRNYFRMNQFASLAKMTGGRSLDYPQIDVALLSKILETVKSDGLQQYVAGFALPSTSSAPTQHTLQVRLKSKSAGKLEGGRRRAVY